MEHEEKGGGRSVRVAQHRANPHLAGGGVEFTTSDLQACHAILDEELTQLLDANSWGAGPLRHAPLVTKAQVILGAVTGDHAMVAGRLQAGLSIFEEMVAATSHGDTSALHAAEKKAEAFLASVFNANRRRDPRRVAEACFVLIRTLNTFLLLCARDDHHHQIDAPRGAPPVLRQPPTNSCKTSNYR